MSGIRNEGDWSKFNNSLHKIVDFNFTGMNKDIGEALVSSTRNRFREQKGPDGRPWKKSLRAKTTGGQTLVDTGRLKNSITSRATSHGVEVGTNDKRASIHQGNNGRDVKIKAKKAKALRFKIGNSWAIKKSVTIPARPFIGISDDDQEEVTDIINEHIEECIRK